VRSPRCLLVAASLVVIVAIAPASAPGQTIDAATVDTEAAGATIGKASPAAAILRAQVRLDRAGFSVGEIDGRCGDNTARAITAFQRAHDLEPTGTVDAATWMALGEDVPTLVAYTITAEDVAGPFVEIPTDMMAKAKLEASSFSSPLEALAERVHASPKLLAALNPGTGVETSGETIQVPNVGVGPRAPAASVVVDEDDRSVTVLDGGGRTIARYPASVGSEHDPLPVGEWTIKGVARNPPFHYNPKLFWDAEKGHAKAVIPPGPNNPVGVVWIDLSKEHYGIHGTPEPSRIARSESHGCIRLTNWDAVALAEQVKPGTPAVLKK
jgi:lipoprotein-anchoring transpeptidase ErfK/SrfK